VLGLERAIGVWFHDAGHISFSCDGVVLNGTTIAARVSAGVAEL